MPIVPVALDTQAWANGKRLKDLGSIDPSRRVRIAFGEALPVARRGAEEHQQVVEFIQEHLAGWAAEDGGPQTRGGEPGAAPAGDTEGKPAEEQS